MNYTFFLHLLLMYYVGLHTKDILSALTVGSQDRLPTKLFSTFNLLLRGTLRLKDLSVFFALRNIYCSIDSFIQSIFSAFLLKFLVVSCSVSWRQRTSLSLIFHLVVLDSTLYCNFIPFIFRSTCEVFSSNLHLNYMSFFFFPK